MRTSDYISRTEQSRRKGECCRLRERAEEERGGEIGKSIEEGGDQALDALEGPVLAPHADEFESANCSQQSQESPGGNRPNHQEPVWDHN